MFQTVNSENLPWLLLCNLFFLRLSTTRNASFLEPLGSPISVHRGLFLDLCYHHWYSQFDLKIFFSTCPSTVISSLTSLNTISICFYFLELSSNESCVGGFLFFTGSLFPSSVVTLTNYTQVHFFLLFLTLFLKLAFLGFVVLLVCISSTMSCSASFSEVSQRTAFPKESSE